MGAALPQLHLMQCGCETQYSAGPAPWQDLLQMTARQESCGGCQLNLLIVPKLPGCNVQLQKMMSAGFNRSGWCTTESQTVH